MFLNESEAYAESEAYDSASVAPIHTRSKLSSDSESAYDSASVASINQALLTLYSSFDQFPYLIFACKRCGAYSRAAFISTTSKTLRGIWKKLSEARTRYALSSETQGQLIRAKRSKPGKNRKFSIKVKEPLGNETVSPDHFQATLRMLAPD